MQRMCDLERGLRVGKRIFALLASTSVGTAVVCRLIEQAAFLEAFFNLCVVISSC